MNEKDNEKLINVLIEQNEKLSELVIQQNDMIKNSNKDLHNSHKECNKINLIILGMSLITMTIIICFFIYAYFFSSYDQKVSVDNHSYSESTINQKEGGNNCEFD